MNNDTETSWNNKHVYKVREQRSPEILTDIPDSDKLKKTIEPWLTALFQSEHLSLLVGAGISSAAHWIAKRTAADGMAKFDFTVFEDKIETASKKSAQKSGRGTPNIEDQIRVSNELVKGLEIYIGDEVVEKLSSDLETFAQELQNGLNQFAKDILTSETNIIESCNSEKAAEYLMSFLVSFASRSASRERLNIFTTNYDRIIEYAAELAGVRLIDRFVGTINPIFRSSRVEVDMHYNSPGIRGEPRYLEGVVHFTKLHGSLDWAMKDGVVRRIGLPYGASSIERYVSKSDTLMIYPNASKDRETSEYPYVELFRDLAAAACCPNSTLVLYGYSFGDEHINRVITDMLTIHSTHLVIISYSDEGDRIKRFYEKLKRPAQISLLIGSHFADLETLVDHYLPKPAIDRTTIKMSELLKARGIAAPQIEATGGEVL
ncbi:SIR2 family protein [Kiritimatiellaeota bacterium B1221]|nr:SIR2 family protein [Kiritimatiellaeota bacterium B1221]